MEKLKLLIIIPKRKPDFPETGIENDTIFKDLPGNFAKPSQKPQKKASDRNGSILVRQNNGKIIDDLSAIFLFRHPRVAIGNFGNLFIVTMLVTPCNRDVTSSGNLIEAVRIAHQFAHHLRA